MAIISCPACSKRISSAAKQCQFCKATFDDSIDDEKIAREYQNKRFAKKQSLQNYSFLTVLLFTAGVILMYVGSENGNEILNQAGTIALSIGFVGYIVTRFMLFIGKRK